MTIAAFASIDVLVVVTLHGCGGVRDPLDRSLVRLAYHIRRGCFNASPVTMDCQH